MQKNLSSYLSTSRFAQLCGTNKRTLFHYDAIGLLPPGKVDAKGYRYYTEAQYGLFQIIIALKEMGMSLAEIKSFIDQRDPQRFHALLGEQKQRVEEQISQLIRVRQMIDTKLALLHEASEIPPDRFEDPFLEEHPEEYFILSARVDSDAHDRFTHALYEHLGYCERRHFQEGYPFGAMISSTALKMNKFNEYAYFFTKVLQPADDPHLFCRPAGRYACLYLRGNYREPEQAYRRLLRFFEEQGLEMGDYSYKEGVIDETAELRLDRFVTKLLIPIRETSGRESHPQ